MFSAPMLLRKHQQHCGTSCELDVEAHERWQRAQTQEKLFLEEARQQALAMELVRRQLAEDARAARRERGALGAHFSEQINKVEERIAAEADRQVSSYSGTHCCSCCGGRAHTLLGAHTAPALHTHCACTVRGSWNIALSVAAGILDYRA